MSLRSGRYRHRLKFLQGTKRTESGQEIEDAKVILDAVPAAIRNLSGQESLRGPQVVAGATQVIETRFIHQLETTPDMHCLMLRDPPGLGAQRRFNILRTVDPDSRRQELWHYVVEQPIADG